MRRHTGTSLDVLGEREDVLACTSWPDFAWTTPDGKRWAPQDVLQGWGGGHISDRWACSTLARWVREKRVVVEHIELPEPLTRHNPEDPAWKVVSALGDSAILEPDSWYGRADLGVCNGGLIDLLVEFGTCFPGKFLLNVGSGFVCDWGIVPYHCPYGFVFSVQPGHRPILRMKRAPTDLSSVS